MSLVMHVDTAAWRSHQDAVLAGDRLTVPVIKGNGYGFGLERLAGELRTSARAGVPCWCIFDNTASGAVVSNALALQALLADETAWSP